MYLDCNFHRQQQILLTIHNTIKCHCMDASICYFEYVQYCANFTYRTTIGYRQICFFPTLNSPNISILIIVPVLKPPPVSTFLKMFLWYHDLANFRLLIFILHRKPYCSCFYPVFKYGKSKISEKCVCVRKVYSLSN